MRNCGLVAVALIPVAVALSGCGVGDAFGRGLATSQTHYPIEVLVQDDGLAGRWAVQGADHGATIEVCPRAAPITDGRINYSLPGSGAEGTMTTYTLDVSQAPGLLRSDIQPDSTQRVEVYPFAWGGAYYAAIWLKAAPSEGQEDFESWEDGPSFQCVVAWERQGDVIRVRAPSPTCSITWLTTSWNTEPFTARRHFRASEPFGQGNDGQIVYMASVDDLLVFYRDFGQDPSLWGETIELRRIAPGQIR